MASLVASYDASFFHHTPAFAWGVLYAVCGTAVAATVVLKRGVPRRGRKGKLSSAAPAAPAEQPHVALRVAL